WTRHHVGPTPSVTSYTPQVVRTGHVTATGNELQTAMTGVRVHGDEFGSPVTTNIPSPTTRTRHPRYRNPATGNELQPTVTGGRVHGDEFGSPVTTNNPSPTTRTRHSYRSRHPPRRARLCNRVRSLQRSRTQHG